jgi:hypothetical protein
LIRSGTGSAAAITDANNTATKARRFTSDLRGESS